MPLGYPAYSATASPTASNLTVPHTVREQVEDGRRGAGERRLELAAAGKGA